MVTPYLIAHTGTSNLSWSIAGTSNTLTLDTSALSGSWTFKFPATAGSNGQVLSTDGSGNLNWVTNTATNVSTMFVGSMNCGLVTDTSNVCALNMGSVAVQANAWINMESIVQNFGVL